MNRNADTLLLYQQFNEVFIGILTKVWLKLNYFNYSDDILNFILKYLPVKNPEISLKVNAFVVQIFEDEHSGFGELIRTNQVENS